MSTSATLRFRMTTLPRRTRGSHRLPGPCLSSWRPWLRRLHRPKESSHLPQSKYLKPPKFNRRCSNNLLEPPLPDQILTLRKASLTMRSRVKSTQSMPHLRECRGWSHSRRSSIWRLSSRSWNRRVRMIFPWSWRAHLHRPEFMTQSVSISSRRWQSGTANVKSF